MSSPERCGCHKGCTVDPHLCVKPCVWPGCMTEEEQQELLRELADG